MKVERRAIVSILMILLLAVPLSVFAGGQSEAKAADKIVFAVAAPMTGDSAAMGIQITQGAQIALDEINSAGGVGGKKMEMTVGDDEANPQKATILAQKLASNDKLLFILGHNNSGCSISALPTYEEVGLPVISPTNTAPELTKLGHANYFRVCPSDELVTAQQVLLGLKELGLKKPAVIWENTDYGKSLRDLIADALEENGFKLLADESYVPQVDRDYSAQITKFKGLGVDSVYFMGEYTASALFLKQSDSLGFNAQVIGSSGNSNPKVIEIAGESAEGLYVVAMFDPNDPRPKPKAFIDKYLAKYGERPGEWGAHAYDIVYLVKAALEAGATDRASLIATLRKLPVFEGVTGQIKFDQYGDVPGKKAVVLLVKNGGFTNYVPTKY